MLQRCFQEFGKNPVKRNAIRDPKGFFLRLRQAETIVLTWGHRNECAAWEEAPTLRSKVFDN